jgi:hypothetical protein
MAFRREGMGFRRKGTTVPSAGKGVFAMREDETPRFQAENTAL